MAPFHDRQRSERGRFAGGEKSFGQGNKIAGISGRFDIDPDLQTSRHDAGDEVAGMRKVEAQRHESGMVDFRPAVGVSAKSPHVWGDVRKLGERHPNERVRDEKSTTILLKSETRKALALFRVEESVVAFEQVGILGRIRSANEDMRVVDLRTGFL